MNMHPNDATLQRYLDDELSSSGRARVAAHLRGCRGCQDLLDDYTQLRASIDALPADVDPGIDLWPAIEGEIGESATSRVLPFKRSEHGRSGSGRLPARLWRSVAAAGAIAATLTIGIALGRQFGGPQLLNNAAMGDSTAGMANETGVPALEGDPVAAGGGTRLPAALAGNDDSGYQQAVADLETLLRESGDRLQPETIGTVMQNLEIIDAAIAASLEAIRADPANQRLQQHLAKNMQKKLDLLRAVTDDFSREL